MTDRYQHPGVGKIWNPGAEYRRWAMVELAAAAAQFPDKVGTMRDALRNLLDSDIELASRVQHLELSTGHDVAAFVEVCSRELDAYNHDGQLPLSQYFHFRLTSSDVVDTANALAVKEALDVLTSVGVRFAVTCEHFERDHAMMAVGRTHGRAAQPVRFGGRAGYWAARMRSTLRHVISVGQDTALGRMGGPTGTEIGEDTESEILRSLSLPLPRRPHIQCTDRVLYYRILAACLEVGLVLEKVATDVRLLAVEEVGEANEGYPPGRVGSSSMPHKRNPVNFEKVCGLVRLLRGYVAAAAENTGLWLERDISHSSVERVLLPDFFHVLLHCLAVATEGIRNLDVDPVRVKENLGRSAGKMESYKTLHEDAKTHGRSAAHRRGRGEPVPEGGG